MKKWKMAYIFILVLFGVCGIALKEYLVTGFLLSSNIGFLIDAKKSRAGRTAQLVVLSIAVVLGCLYWYFRMKAAGQ